MSCQGSSGAAAAADTGPDPAWLDAWWAAPSEYVREMTGSESVCSWFGSDHTVLLDNERNYEWGPWVWVWTDGVYQVDPITVDPEPDGSDAWTVTLRYSLRHETYAATPCGWRD